MNPAPKCTPAELRNSDDPRDFVALTGLRRASILAPVPTASAAAAKSRTAQFVCPDCGHEFRKRTKAGIYTTCPKCKARALSREQMDRLVAAAARNATAPAARREKRATAPSSIPSRAPSPAAAAPISSEPARRQPPRIVPAARPTSDPAAATSPAPGGTAPSVEPVEQAPEPVAARGRPGFVTRLFGYPDD